MGVAGQECGGVVSPALLFEFTWHVLDNPSY